MEGTWLDYFGHLCAGHFWQGEMSREIWLRELQGAHRGKSFFAPITALLLPESFIRQMGGSAVWYGSQGRHRIILVLAQGALDDCNIKPSTDIKAVCRHQREFPTRCTDTERLRHSKQSLSHLCTLTQTNPSSIILLQLWQKAK